MTPTPPEKKKRLIRHYLQGQKTACGLSTGLALNDDLIVSCYRCRRVVRAKRRAKKKLISEDFG